MQAAKKACVAYAGDSENPSNPSYGGQPWRPGYIQRKRLLARFVGDFQFYGGSSEPTCLLSMMTGAPVSEGRKLPTATFMRPDSVVQDEAEAISSPRTTRRSVGYR